MISLLGPLVLAAIALYHVVMRAIERHKSSQHERLLVSLRTRTAHLDEKIAVARSRHLAMAEPLEAALRAYNHGGGAMGLIAGIHEALQICQVRDDVPGS